MAYVASRLRLRIALSSAVARPRHESRRVPGWRFVACSRVCPSVPQDSTDPAARRRVRQRRPGMLPFRAVCSDLIATILGRLADAPSRWLFQSKVDPLVVIDIGVDPSADGELATATGALSAQAVVHDETLGGEVERAALHEPISTPASGTRLDPGGCDSCPVKNFIFIGIAAATVI